MKQFIEHTPPSLTNPVLLLLDNHFSHISCPVSHLCNWYNSLIISTSLFTLPSTLGCVTTVEKNVNAIDERVLNAYVRNGHEVNESVHQQRTFLNLNNSSVPSTSGFSPKIVHPFPKAPKRNENPRRRLKRRKTVVLTDTPENNAIEEEKRFTDEKKRKK
ncbi:hypothetical protein PR048_015138 [Dryococelus australis]|uniref:DDE-1 domain-containing protein n=1 Tax=Dryococelus australis TaxID=614101 RepID=A0ABQ9HG96_9NEOP|nr:hypothetical protein PR048_015138 [Dryococelus australis]